MFWWEQRRLSSTDVAVVMKTLGAKGPCFPKSRINENSGIGQWKLLGCLLAFYRFDRLFEMRSSISLPQKRFWLTFNEAPSLQLIF